MPAPTIQDVLNNTVQAATSYSQLVAAITTPPTQGQLQAVFVAGRKNLQLLWQLAKLANVTLEIPANPPAPTPAN